MTRDAAIGVLAAVTVPPVTTTVRGIASEVRLGRREGVAWSVASCDNPLTIPKSLLDPKPAGRLGSDKMRALDAALRYAAGITW